MNDENKTPICVVYKYTFLNRLANNTPPYYYIGSKSNCYVKDNNIYYFATNKRYLTSSSHKEVKDMIRRNEHKLEILFEALDRSTVLSTEREFQIEFDVIQSEEYYNMMYAGKTADFSSPNYIPCLVNSKNKYVTKKFFDENKDSICKAINKDRRYYIDEKDNNYLLYPDDNRIKLLNLKLGKSKKGVLRGSDNPFYGKKHSDESKKKIIASRNKFYEENPEYCEQIKNNQINNMKKVSQLPKSEKFLKQLKDRMTTTLYITNVETGESKRISKDDYQEYKANGWITHVTHANKLNKLTANDITCLYCGFTSKENNSSFHKWHNDNCKNNPINADRWSPWLDVKDDKYKYYMYSKYDIIYDLYQANKALSGKKLLPLIKNEIIDRELTDSEYLFFKRMINKIKKDNFIPLGSESWKSEFKRK